MVSVVHVERKAIPIVFIKQDEPDRVCPSVAMMRIVAGYGSTYLANIRNFPQIVSERCAIFCLYATIFS